MCKSLLKNIVSNKIMQSNTCRCAFSWWESNELGKVEQRLWWSTACRSCCWYLIQLWWNGSDALGWPKPSCVRPPCCLLGWLLVDDPDEEAAQDTVWVLMLTSGSGFCWPAVRCHFWVRGLPQHYRLGLQGSIWATETTCVPNTSNLFFFFPLCSFGYKGIWSRTALLLMERVGLRT